MNTLDLYVSVSKKVYIIMKIFIVLDHYGGSDIIYHKNIRDKILGVFKDKINAEKCVEENREFDKKVYFRVDHKYHIIEKELQ